MATAAVFQAKGTFAPRVSDTLYDVETGSAASAIAICIALIATI
jgi:hypothetical protein